MSAPPTPPLRTPRLCVADDDTFWPWFSSPRIGAWPDRESQVVVVPIAGTADWGLGHPMDAEETVLLTVLRDGCRIVDESRRPLVVPPLRFVFGADPSCAFAVDQQAAHALIAEVAASVAAAGFRKIVLLNASPWNEEICGAAARDLRVSRGLHMFQVHLSAIELDFHPVRSRTRRRLQTLLTHLYGAEPETGTSRKTPSKAGTWGDETVTPLPGPAVRLTEARTEGAAILAASAGRLAKLLSDIHERAPLSAKLTPP